MKIKLPWLLILLALVLVSCRDLVQDEFPDFNVVPTVNSILVSGYPVNVNISLSGKIDTNQLKLVNDANVLLYVDGDYKETLVRIEEGLYESSTVVEPLKTYRCEVNIPGFQTVLCEDSIPESPILYELVHINIAGKDEEGMTYPAIKFSFKNDPAEKKYFEVVIRLLEYGNEVMPQLEAITDPVLLSEGLPITLFSNELIKDTIYTMTINYFTGGAFSRNGDPIRTSLVPLIFELRSVSYSHYQYIRQLYLYNIGRYPDFIAGSITAFPLYSDVEGGYGIFSGYSAVVSDTLYPHY
jgi:hypothetical protein